jgi:hypothetical protein
MISEQKEKLAHTSKKLAESVKEAGELTDNVK